MLPLLAEVMASPTTPMLLADGDSGGGLIALPFVVGPAVFAAVYGVIYRYYRNTDKRHRYERETQVAVGNLRQGDQKVGRRTRLRNRSMSGRNETDPLERVQRIRVR